MAEKEVKLFGKYDYKVEVVDPSLKNFISTHPMEYPHTFARTANKQFAKAKVNLVERLANKLMRGGTGEKLGGKLIRTNGSLQGKKQKVLRIVEESFDLVAAKTKQNPLQLLIKAVENSAPREEITRVKFGGTAYQVAVDVASQRRLDLSLRNLSLAAITVAFKSRTTLAEALANEIELAAKNDANSFSIKKKNDLERMAKAAR